MLHKYVRNVRDEVFGSVGNVNFRSLVDRFNHLFQL